MRGASFKKQKRCHFPSQMPFILELTAEQETN